MTEKIWISKLCGTVILLLASFVFGWKKIREERRQIDEAEALENLVEYIAEQIEYTMKPLPEILGGVESEILRSSGLIDRAREVGLREAWEACAMNLSLPDGDLRGIFGEFSREIGRGYRKEELELCSLTLKRMRAEIEKLKGDARSREKLYRTLPPLMVLSVVLILL